MAKKRENNFASTVEDYHRIMHDLQSGKFSPLYLLCGEEGYFIDKICDYIAENAIDKELHDFNLNILYGSEHAAGSITEHAMTYPMMSDRRVVIVKEAVQIKDFTKLEKYFDDPSSSTILVICYKGKSLDKRLVVTKRAISNGVFFESVPARDYEIKTYLTELVMSRKCSIDAKAKELLVDHLGCDLRKIDNEIIKLLNAIGENENKITSSHIEKYIGISKDYNIFELTTALGTKNMAKALTIANYFEENPKSNPLVVILPSIFKYFLSLFCVGMIVQDSKKKGKPIPNNYEITKMAKLSNAYFVDKYLAAARIYPPLKSLNILGVIRKYDMKSKGIDTGSLSDGEILRELLLKIFNL